MAKKNNLCEENVKEDNIQEKEIKKELCKILYVEDHYVGMYFKDFGIQITTEGIVDKSLIKDYMWVEYESDIGFPDFKFQLIFD